MGTGLRLAMVMGLIFLGCSRAVEESEERRMSPAAEKLLLEIASVRTGHANFRLHRSKDGKPGMRCEGICGLSPESPAREEVLAELAILGPLADADGSGWISTREAEEFHELYVFGRLVAEIFPKGIPSRGQAAWELEMTPERLDALLKRSEELPLGEER